MKKYLVLCWLFVAPALGWANESADLSPAQLKQLLVEVNELQNNVLLQNSTIADLNKLFARYTEDFEYIHEVYGGTYSRQHLYKNYAAHIKDGKYSRTDARYKIVTMIVGLNAVAVERQEVHAGVTSHHLTVFEFRADKVSRIIEYWK